MEKIKDKRKSSEPSLDKLLEMAEHTKVWTGPIGWWFWRHDADITQYLSVNKYKTIILISHIEDPNDELGLLYGIEMLTTDSVLRIGYWYWPVGPHVTADEVKKFFEDYKLEHQGDQRIEQLYKKIAGGKQCLRDEEELLWRGFGIRSK